MKETIFIVWGVLAFILTFLFRWIAKRYKRRPGKIVVLQKLALSFLMFGLGCLLYYFLENTLNFVWITRTSFLIFGILHLWMMYSQTWAERDKFSFKEDSFWPEFLFISLGSVLGAIFFCLGPQVTGLVDYKVDVSAGVWEIPLIFLFPFLVFKLLDFSTHIPYHFVENRWVYPLEPVNVESWQWRDLMQVNFKLRVSLVEEYKLFGNSAKPWIEVPKNASLGHVFRLAMQERRRRVELTTIQDLGDEYKGSPMFWWLFSIKVIWWNPNTWFREPRFLDPNRSISSNKIKKNDIILVRRIPVDDTSDFEYSYQSGQASSGDQTVIIRR